MLLNYAIKGLFFSLAAILGLCHILPFDGDLGGKIVPLVLGKGISSNLSWG